MRYIYFSLSTHHLSSPEPCHYLKIIIKIKSSCFNFTFHQLDYLPTTNSLCSSLLLFYIQHLLIQPLATPNTIILPGIFFVCFSLLNYQDNPTYLSILLIVNFFPIFHLSLLLSHQNQNKRLTDLGLDHLLLSIILLNHLTRKLTHISPYPVPEMTL